MTAVVELPYWGALAVGTLAGWAVLDKFVAPLLRRLARNRVERTIDEVGRRLRIEIRPFQRTRRQTLIELLVFDPRVQEAATAWAAARRVPRELAQQAVERHAREIVPAFNAYLYFRLGYWLARRLVQALYRVRLGYTDEAGMAAIGRDATVVFVINHRSNMDYILAAYLAADQAALSYAVGEWARIWPLQQLIRAMGAYFVRRSSQDPLYRRVLERYIARATENGVTQAVFPEGGLSRDGRLREPKLGVIDYMLRGFDPGGARDLVFIPLGINYDRVLEDRTLLLSLAPEAPRPGKAAAVASTLRFLAHNLRLMLASRWKNFGYACVNFGTPLSMKTWCIERGVDFRRMGEDERRASVAGLGEDLMRAVGRMVPVLPVSLVATVFRASPGARLSLLELKAETRALIERLQAAGAWVYVPRRDADFAIDAGLDMLVQRRLVRADDGLYAAAPGEDALLDYYANAIAHLLPGRDSGRA